MHISHLVTTSSFYDTDKKNHHKPTQMGPEYSRIKNKSKKTRFLLQKCFLLKKPHKRNKKPFVLNNKKHQKQCFLFKKPFYTLHCCQAKVSFSDAVHALFIPVNVPPPLIMSPPPLFLEKFQDFQTSPIMSPLQIVRARSEKLPM